MTFIYLFLIALPIYIALDLIWLRLIAYHLYRSYIGKLLGPVNWTAAITFYIFFGVGLTFFAVNPAFAAGSIGYALMLGGLYGFFTYATYDLTNLATLRDWPSALSVIDIIWGVVVSSATASLALLVAQSILG